MAKSRTRVKKKTKASKGSPTKRSHNSASPRRGGVAGSGFLIAGVLLALLVVVGGTTGGGESIGSFGRMKRYEAKTFSIKVPDTFMERVGAKEIENGVEKRTYNGVGAGGRYIISVRVTSSPSMQDTEKTQARNLAKELARNTGGDYKEYSQKPSNLSVKGAQEVWFSYTDSLGVPYRGVIAYGRRSGRDYRVDVLYAASDAGLVEDRLVEAVLESFKTP